MTPDELNSLRATVGASSGLTPAQAARLQGTTQAEMEADAANLLRLFGPSAPQTPSGGEVPGTARTMADGEARYRAQQGLDENGNRPEAAPVNENPLGSPRNPVTRSGYQMER